MKHKSILLVIYITFFLRLANSQHIDIQKVFVATSEKEVYEIYNQMLDSARLSNYFLEPHPMIEKFSFGYFEEIESKDTLMKFEQECRKNFQDHICQRVYWSYLSNNMPINFYEHFLLYLKQLDRIENYYIKSSINGQLLPIMRIMINQYESGKLNEQDNIKAQQLIEETMLRLINDNHNYRWLTNHDKYITDKVRKALVNVIQNPFYPVEYLDFYMSQQDTLKVDTVGIPDYIKKKYEKERFYADEIAYYERLSRFYI